jgi:hypothetical protein
MKQIKIQFVLLLFITISFLQAQGNTDKLSPPAPQTQVLLFKAFEKTLEAFRVKIMSGELTVTGGYLAADSLSTDGYVHYALRDSLNSTTSDSILIKSLGFNHWFDGDIYVNDTTKISFTKDFTAGTVDYIYPNIPTPLLRWNTANVTKLYLKRFRTTGVIWYSYRLRGR